MTQSSWKAQLQNRSQTWWAYAPRVFFWYYPDQGPIIWWSRDQQRKFFGGWNYCHSRSSNSIKRNSLRWWIKKYRLELAARVSRIIVLQSLCHINVFSSGGPIDISASAKSSSKSESGKRTTLDAPPHTMNTHSNSQSSSTSGAGSKCSSPAGS